MRLMYEPEGFGIKNKRGVIKQGALDRLHGQISDM